MRDKKKQSFPHHRITVSELVARDTCVHEQDESGKIDSNKQKLRAVLMFI